MLAASWNAPSFVAPSPKKGMATFMRSRPSMRAKYLFEKAAPTAIGGPAATMPFAPSMPASTFEMCMLPPRPLL